MCSLFVGHRLVYSSADLFARSSRLFLFAVPVVVSPLVFLFGLGPGSWQGFWIFSILAVFNQSYSKKSGLRLHVNCITKCKRMPWLMS